MTTARTCPACSTAYSPTARICPKCRLEVAKMDAFAAAKHAAAKKGLRSTTIQTDTPSIYGRILRPIFIFPAIILVIVIYYLTRPAPPPAWTRFPATQRDAAQSLLDNLAVDDNKYYDRAYALIAPAAHDPEYTDEPGLYRQLFMVINHYLSQEIGSDWPSHTTLETDKNDPDTIVAHIGLETLHIRTASVTPPDKLDDTNHHYGIMGINEFDVADAPAYQQLGAAWGVMRFYGAGGAISSIQSIQAALGGRPHEKPMQTKLRVLPTLRNPRTISRMATLQTWPVRKDPVVRNRLEQITTDDRYDPEVKQAAQDVLKDNVPLEDLIAGHVNTDD